jgi:hypothetical protein
MEQVNEFNYFEWYLSHLMDVGPKLMKFLRIDMARKCTLETMTRRDTYTGTRQWQNLFIYVGQMLEQYVKGREEEVKLLKCIF